MLALNVFSDSTVTHTSQKYLLPHLQPPSSTAYEADRDALTAQFDEAESMLKQIQEETAGIKQAVEEQKAKVEQTTQDVDDCVREMREADERNRDEMREIREEVNSIREMLPKVCTIPFSASVNEC